MVEARTRAKGLYSLRLTARAETWTATLPDERTPTKADWAKISRQWRPLLDRRIEELTRLRAELTDCIGCGCLSLRACALYNPADVAARNGPGPRYLIGDRPRSVEVAPSDGP